MPPKYIDELARTYRCHDLGWRPAEEWSDHGRAQCEALIAQIKRLHGEPPARGMFALSTLRPWRANTPLHVWICWYDGDEETESYAQAVIDQFPETWDAQARAELAQQLIEA